MMYRYLAIRKHMTEISLKQYNALENPPLSLILINALSRLNLLVSLVMCTLQKESSLTYKGRSHQADAATDQ